MGCGVTATPSQDGKQRQATGRRDDRSLMHGVVASPYRSLYMRRGLLSSHRSPSFRLCFGCPRPHHQRQHTAKGPKDDVKGNKEPPMHLPFYPFFVLLSFALISLSFQQFPLSVLRMSLLQNPSNVRGHPTRNSLARPVHRNVTCACAAACACPACLDRPHVLRPHPAVTSWCHCPRCKDLPASFNDLTIL